MANNAVINFIFNTSAAEKALADFKNKMGQSANAIGNSFMGALGATESLKQIGGQIKTFYNEILDTALFAQHWNLPVEEVSKFSNAIEMLGGSSADARGLLGTLQNAIIDLRANGGGALKDVSSRMALAVQNWDGSFKTSIELISALRSEFGHLSEAGQIDALRKLGLDSQVLMRYMRLSNDEFNQLNKRAEENGVITSKSAQGVMKFNDSVLRMRNAFKGFQMRLFAEGQDGIIEKLIGLMDWLANTSDETKGAILGVTTALLSLGPIISVLANLFKSLNLIGSGVKLLLTLFNPWALALAAVGAALYTLYSKSETFRAFVQNCIKYGKEFVSGFIMGIWDALSWLLSKIPFVGDDLAKSMEKIKKEVVDSFDEDIAPKVETVIRKADNGAYNADEDLAFLNKDWTPANQFAEDDFGNMILPKSSYAPVSGQTTNSESTVNNYDNKQYTVNVYTDNFDNGRRLGADIRSGIAQQQSSGVRIGG